MTRTRPCPSASCPLCQSPRTRVRYVRRYPNDDHPTVIRRHRRCYDCKCRFRTESPVPKEIYAGLDPPPRR
jgi:transcriptional regulator NrdR family protein